MAASCAADFYRYLLRAVDLTVAASGILRVRSVGSLVRLGSDLGRGIAQTAA